MANTDPVKKNKNSKSVSKRKAYMQYADRQGIDTTNIVVKNNVLRIKDEGATYRKIKERPKKDVVVHYKGKEGKTYRVPRMGDVNRVLSRGVRVDDKKAVPKHFWGALIGAGVSTVSSLIQGNKQKKLQEEARINAQNQRQAQINAQDAIELDQYESEGQGIVDYYKEKGGIISNFYKTKGGKLHKLSNNSVIAKGNKHEESKIDNTSGIKLYKKGKAIAEIEDGEVIKDNKMVYSDRLKVDNKDTYADKAKKLAVKKNNTTSKKEKALLNKAENTLFLHQEVNKTQKNKKNTAKFGDFLKGEKGKKLGENLVPFIDNISNAILTANTPKITKPSLERIKNRKTTVNVNPQLAAVNDAVAGATKNIQNNTANSNVARANIASARLAGAKQKAGILAAKENKETDLSNANQDRIQATQARNLDKLNQHTDKELARQSAIQGQISSNVSNLTGDIVDNINRAKKEKLDNRRLDIVEQMYNTGTTNRAKAKLPYYNPVPPSSSAKAPIEPTSSTSKDALTGNTELAELTRLPYEQLSLEEKQRLNKLLRAKSI